MNPAVPGAETVSETGSTNADIARHIRSGGEVAEGYWLRARQQSAGKGRHGREWVSPPGNLYCSTAIRLGPNDPPPHTLSFVAGLVLAEVAARYLPARAGGTAGEGSALLLKWPNDLMCDQGKLAGILLERHGDYVIIGMGVNIAAAPQIAAQSKQQAAVLSALCGAHAPSAAQLFADLRHAFPAALSAWRERPLAETLASWQRRAHRLGTRLAVHDDSGAVLAGRYGGLGADGALILELEGGAMRVIHAGDVILKEQG